MKLNKERKKLSETQREIVVGKDKSRCHRELLEWSRVWPFDVYCPKCYKAMKYEDEIIFHKKSKMDKFVEKLTDNMDTETKRVMLNEYDKLKESQNDRKI